MDHGIALRQNIRPDPDATNYKAFHSKKISETTADVLTGIR